MDPSPCANGCGFYGLPQNLNMCSKCHREHRQAVLAESLKLLNPTKTTTSNHQETKLLAGSLKLLNLTTTTTTTTTKQDCPHSSTSSQDVIGFSTNGDALTNKKSRCTSCSKKVGMLGFNCKCGNLFCGTHRYPEAHACNVDLKSIGRDILAKQNPLCEADKLPDRV